MEVARILRGAAAGGAAAATWAAQQPLDKRLLGCSFSDVELLGKAVTRERGWPLAGLALHVGNGLAFGAAYAILKPALPGPAVARGVLAAMAEHVASWPLVRLVDSFHPAREELVKLAGNRRALVQATWRHLVFGAVLGLLEDRLNGRAPDPVPPAPIDAASNGHGRLEEPAAVAGRPAAAP